MINVPSWKRRAISWRSMNAREAYFIETKSKSPLFTINLLRCGEWSLGHQVKTHQSAELARSQLPDLQDLRRRRTSRRRRGGRCHRWSSGVTSPRARPLMKLRDGGNSKVKLRTTSNLVLHCALIKWTQVGDRGDRTSSISSRLIVLCLPSYELPRLDALTKEDGRA